MDPRRTLAGIGYGLLAYVIWGGFPLFFRQLAHVPPMAILTHRTVWSFVLMTALLTLWRRWPVVLALRTEPVRLLRLGIAALLLGANWLGFLWAVDQHRVVEASLGYFLTPLVNVLLGMLVLGERQSGKEKLAIGLAVLAVANELFVLGTLPWISLFLAATFGLYGLLRKQVPVDALSGLWLETLAMLPVAALYVAWQEAAGHSVFAFPDPSTAAMLVAAGVLTALPLMAFAAATQRLPLAMVGMLMYINPTLQFVTAVLIFGEPLQPARVLSFGLIWLGLAIFTHAAWEKMRLRA